MDEDTVHDGQDAAADDRRIRELIETWAAAVQAGDLDAVLAHHCDDLVMFDVPPPQDGVRGLDAYARVWPDFFAWQAGGSSFDVVDLYVEAGTDVAFAWALLRCGTDEEYAEHPDRRLRVSFGLRRTDDGWAIAHEHHSFPYGD